MQQAESSRDTVQRRKNSCLRDAFVFLLWHTSRRQPIAVIGGRCQSRADNLQPGTVHKNSWHSSTQTAMNWDVFNYRATWNHVTPRSHWLEHSSSASTTNNWSRLRSLKSTLEVKCCGSCLPSLGVARHIAVDSHGNTFVADSHNRRILLLDAHLSLRRVIIDEYQLNYKQPWRLCYTEQPGQLLFALYSRVAVFDVLCR